MTTATTDQQLIIPLGADANDVVTTLAQLMGTSLVTPGLSGTSGIESRLVKRYLSAVDRTARNPAPPVGEVSVLTNTSEIDLYNGAFWERITTALIAVKTADQSITSSTTFVDVTDMSVTVAGNATYRLDALVRNLGVAAGDVGVQFVGPAGATLDWAQGGLQSGASNLVDDSYYGSLGIGNAAFYAGVSANAVAQILGVLQTSSGGTFKMQFAQGTSSASASWILARTFMSLTRLI